jgi:O-acetyl-ADP-ribose deacetylase (regulator of RNase III)
MREERGDLWSYPAEYRCVTTNGVVLRGQLVMGKGVALQAKKLYPDLPFTLGVWVKRYGNRPFRCRKEGIITFPTKHDWHDDSSLSLILASARAIVEMVNKFGIQSVALPRPGCGNGNLSWQEVGPALAEILDDRFVVLTP